MKNTENKNTKARYTLPCGHAETLSRMSERAKYLSADAGDTARKVVIPESVLHGAMKCALAELALSSAERSALDYLEWATDQFGSLTTSRTVPRRVVMKLVERGMAESVGVVSLVDADGSIRHGCAPREGFILTPHGRDVLDAINSTER